MQLRYASVTLFFGFLSFSAYLFADDTSESPGSDTSELDTMVVEGFSREYLANKSQTSAVGLDLTQLKTPAAVSVISQDILLDQQVNNVDDALRNVPGVTKFKTGNGGEEKFSIRGFDASQSIYKDGARINNPLNVSNIPSTETANIERIEVLKGPSALLYGQGEPGGMINYITKRPQFDEQGTVELIGGSDNFYKIEADYTNALFNSDQLAFRVVGAYQDSDSFRDEVFRERLMLNPTLLWEPSETSSLVLGYEYIDDSYTQDRGQVLELTNPDSPASEHIYEYTGRLDNDQFFGIPGWNQETEAESKRFYLDGELEINDSWTIEVKYSRTKNDKTNVDNSPFAALEAGSDVVIIGPRKSAGVGKSQQATLNNLFDFNDGFGLEHKVLASLAWEEATSESTSFRTDRNQTDQGAVFYNVVTGDYFSNFTPEEAADPDFQQPANDFGFILRARSPSVDEDRNELGFNLLDYIRITEQWAVLAGGRYSEYEDKLGDRQDNNFSVRGGVVFTPRDDLSFYASYSEGYRPSSGLRDVNDRTVDAELSTAFELGVKWALNDERLLMSAVIYQIELEDVPYIINALDEDGNPTDPDDLRYSNLGSTRSRGLELEVVGQVSEQWRIQGGYTYIDNEITQGGTGEFDSVFPSGNRLPGIAEHNFNLFTFYELPVAGGELGLGGGLFYQGETFISTENRSTYDAWVTADMATYYKWGQWKVQLNVRNVTDEDYQLAQAETATDSFAAIRVGTGAPRTVFASLARQF